MSRASCLSVEFVLETQRCLEQDVGLFRYFAEQTLVDEIIESAPTELPLVVV
jgi:hypothetical protein